MITFKTTPEAIWVSADHELFDSSELGEYSKEERAKIRFKVYPLTPALVRELRQQFLKNRKLSDFETTEIEESEEYQEELMDRLVVDWSGLYDENGTVIPCTTENKVKLFDYGYPRLGICIIRVARLVMSKYSELKEQEEKNLSSSQDGSKEEVKI